MDYFLHAFTYPEWKHLASFGKRGEGPEEMLSAENIQFNSLDSLWAIDANKMEITRWKISPSTRSAERVEEIKLDKELVRSLDFHTMKSGFFIPRLHGRVPVLGSWQQRQTSLKASEKYPPKQSTKTPSARHLPRHGEVLWITIPTTVSWQWLPN